MPRKLGGTLCIVVLLGLATCKAPPPPVHQVAFVPPPPTKPTDHPPICGQPEEINAFRIVGLQTQLMQIAISCARDDGYNAFVRKFQPQLAKQRAVLVSFFTRAYGRRQSHAAYDQYITQLADAESQYNLASGVDFCSLSKATLHQAVALSSADDLVQFVVKVPVQQAMDVETCGTPGASLAIPQTKQFRHRTKRYHS
jgi:hypothetical protein